MSAGRFSRRVALQMGAAAAGVVLRPHLAAAAPALVDPYIGAIPFVFPVALGTYETPFGANWHGLREGQVYQWSHRASTALRAHDGVDVYPQDTSALPPVYAPLGGTIAAVCTRSANTVDAIVDYRASAATPPPWDYSQAIDTVANLPLYGNFVWIRSGEPASAGYFVFFCHLQHEDTVRSLRPDQPVSVATALGLMGDTGNAQGTPQLHVEVHYPTGNRYTCDTCDPSKPGLTSIDPYASLSLASPRAGATITTALAGSAAGKLAANTGGAYANYELLPTASAPLTLHLTYSPFVAPEAHAVGLNVYQAGQRLGTATGQATGIGDAVNSSAPSLTVMPRPAAGSLLIQVFNYGSTPITYALVVSPT